MMQPSTSYRYLAVIAASGLLALALLASSARAEVKRTGGEPWYQQPTADIGRAQKLFARGVSVHQQLLRGDARDLYDQALALWDNPDIRWNLALVLEDLGQYVRAHRELESASRWGKALGTERLRDVRERMAALENKHLARIDVSCDEPATDITLDGQPWFRGSGQQITLVEPGEHYVVARKAGFFPITRPISVTVGQAARLKLPMDADRRIETRRWSTWKPWAVVSAGLVVAATAALLRHDATLNRDSAASSVAGPCDMPLSCPPITKAPDSYGRAVTENRLALGAFVTGGAVAVAGLALIWINQVSLQSHRSEARPLSPIELSPLLSTKQVGISVGRQF
jgi:hypothetical protein